MKKRYFLLVASLAVLMICSCKKENDSVSTYQIAGLWIGTYNFNNQPPLYFSFTIYPDGTMSYKSKGVNNYTFYANGTWNLAGNAFTYTVTTTNNPGSTQSTQSGSAVYSNTGTLTNGTNKDVVTNETGTFSMTRVN